MAKGRESKYTAEQIVTAWRVFNESHDYVKTAGESGLTRPSVYIAVQALRRYLKPGYDLNKISEAYRKAVLMIDGRYTNGTAQPVVNQVGSAEENLKRLESAFMTFQGELVGVIEAEAERRAKEKVSVKEQEIAALKKKYETELQNMQALLIEAKESNVVGFLKKQWLGKS